MTKLVNELPESENEIELSALWQGIRRRLPIILLSTVLLSGVTYFLSKHQSPVYEASSTLVTVPQNSVSSVNSGSGTLVSAGTLPAGALNEAMQGSLVVNKVIDALKQSGLTATVKSQLVDDLHQQLQQGKFKTISLTSKLDYNNNGIYTVTAQGPSPAAARLLADLTRQSLSEWDKGRALQTINQSIEVQKAQLKQIDQQLKDGGLEPIEHDTLIATRAQTQRNLANTVIQAQGVTGSLALVSPAVEPLNPIAPKPTRNAVLAGLLTLLLGSGIAALLTVMDRTVRSEDDLLALGLRTLGAIPRLRQRDIVLNGIVRAARQAGLYEAIGFLRVNLLAGLGQRGGKMVMVSSTAPGEGKSSMTATLADGFAASGQRILIIDADLRRGTQSEVWQKYEQTPQWVQLAGTGGGRTLQAALKDPQNVEVLRVEPNVDVLPAGAGIQDSLVALNRPDLGDLLKQWGQNYDLVLIDSPPLLALADGLVLGRYVDGLVLVTEAGKTTVQAVRQVLRRTENIGVPLLGAVINKVNVSSGDQYTYNYSYAPRGRA